MRKMLPFTQQIYRIEQIPLLLLVYNLLRRAPRQTPRRAVPCPALPCVCINTTGAYVRLFPRHGTARRPKCGPRKRHGAIAVSIIQFNFNLKEKRLI